MIGITLTEDVLGDTLDCVFLLVDNVSNASVLLCDGVEPHRHILNFRMYEAVQLLATGLEATPTAPFVLLIGT